MYVLYAPGLIKEGTRLLHWIAITFVRWRFQNEWKLTRGRIVYLILLPDSIFSIYATNRIILWFFMEFYNGTYFATTVIGKLCMMRNLSSDIERYVLTIITVINYLPLLWLFRDVLNNTNHGKNKFYEDGSQRWKVMNFVNMTLYGCLFTLSLLSSLRKR